MLQEGYRPLRQGECRLGGDRGAPSERKSDRRVGTTPGGPFINTNPGASRCCTSRSTVIRAITVVGIVHPLAALVAQCKRQSVGDLICGGRAQRWYVGHAP
jgi:hypothetical protein